MARFVYGVTFFQLFQLTVSFGGEATRLRIVIVSDGENSWRRGANLSEGCRNNVMFLKSFLNDALDGKETRYTLNGDPENITEQVALNGNAVTPNSVMQFLKGPEFIVDPSESILFYYCGHGAIEDRKESPNFNQHFFLMGMAGPSDKGILARNDVRNVLMGKRPKALFILADACSNYQAIEPVAGAPAPTPDYQGFYQLFYGAEGIVDILAAAPGQRAWFDNTGGMFTTALIEMLYLPQTKLDLNRDGQITWKEVFPILQSTTNEHFQILKRNARVPAAAASDPSSILNFKTQVPAYYYLAEWPKAQ